MRCSELPDGSTEVLLTPGDEMAYVKSGKIVSSWWSPWGDDYIRVHLKVGVAPDGIALRSDGSEAAFMAAPAGIAVRAGRLRDRQDFRLVLLPTATD